MKDSAQQSREYLQTPMLLCCFAKPHERARIDRSLLAGESRHIVRKEFVNLELVQKQADESQIGDAGAAATAP